jgi:hypothetical protein
MPSVDVIRNVKIQGSASGVDETTAALNRLTASIQATNDNLSKSRSIANDNAEGFRITGEGAATAANHLRQAAEAAYAFSPAFRGVVNEMAPAALGAANTALAAVAAGIVTATNYAGTGVIALAGAAEKASPSLLAYTAGVRSVGIAMEAFSPTVTTAAGSLLAFLSPALRLVGWFALAADGIKLVAEAWELGNAKLAEYVALSEKASATGLSTDFYQRIAKYATDAKVPVDQLTTAFKTLQSATADQLGGTSAQQRLKDLTDAGNFKGNTGVGQLAAATTTEDKFRAVSSLIDQAMTKGERLAALDVAKTFLGADVASNLAKDSDYLDKILTQADAVSKTDLVSQTSIDNAVALQNRLDAAEQILSQRWHPIQDLLTQLGIKMKEAWVDIVEAIAKAVDLVFTLAGKIADALAPLLGYLARAEQVLALAGRVGSAIPGPIGAAFSVGSTVAGNLLAPSPAQDALSAARSSLGAGLGNPANSNAARDQANAIQNAIFKDTSKNPADKSTGPDTAAYDRATESILKYIEVTKAASLSVSDAASEQEKFKVVAQLTAAAEKDGTTITASLRDEMDKLAARAGAAADALAKAKEASNIDFGAKTAFLSQLDVQIATQLKGIYGNDIPAALNSTYAASIRLNNSFKEISSAIESNLTSGLTSIVNGSKTAGQAFSDMGKAVLTAIDQMVIKILIVEPLMRSLQSSISGTGLLGLVGLGGGVTSGGAIAGATGATSVGGAPLVAAGLHSGGMVGSDATFYRSVHPAVFDGARRYHTGGLVDDEVPIIARKGERVLTADQAAGWGAGNTTIHYNIDASGADSGTVQRIQNVLTQHARAITSQGRAMASSQRYQATGVA